MLKTHTGHVQDSQSGIYPTQREKGVKREGEREREKEREGEKEGRKREREVREGRESEGEKDRERERERERRERDVPSITPVKCLPLLGSRERY